MSKKEQRQINPNLERKIDEANEKICEMAKAETAKTLAKVLHDASVHMRCTYNRSDN